MFCIMKLRHRKVTRLQQCLLSQVSVKMYRRPDSLRPAVAGVAGRHDQRHLSQVVMQVHCHWRSDHFPAVVSVARRHDQKHLSLVVTDATPSLEERSSPRCGGRGKMSRSKTLSLVVMQVLRHWSDHLPAMAGVARCHDQIHLSLVVGGQSVFQPFDARRPIGKLRSPSSLNKVGNNSKHA